MHRDNGNGALVAFRNVWVMYELHLDGASVPAVLDDPKLRRRLARVLADCQQNYTEAGRALGLSKHMVRRLTLQPHGPIPRTRVKLEGALKAYESRVAITKHTRNTTQTEHAAVPDLAEEVLRYVLQAVEAQRGADQRA
jgi:hypothetical protein